MKQLLAYIRENRLIEKYELSKGVQNKNSASPCLHNLRIMMKLLIYNN